MDQQPPKARVVSAAGNDGIRYFYVLVNGRQCSPTWADLGPAKAYAEAIRSGARQPEYGYV